jgi:hypothetical protein
VSIRLCSAFIRVRQLIFLVSSADVLSCVAPEKQRCNGDKEQD